MCSLLPSRSAVEVSDLRKLCSNSNSSIAPPLAHTVLEALLLLPIPLRLAPLLPRCLRLARAGRISRGALRGSLTVKLRASSASRGHSDVRRHIASWVILMDSYMLSSSKKSFRVADCASGTKMGSVRHCLHPKNETRAVSISEK